MIIIERTFHYQEYENIIFLDRDGVINVNREHYVKSLSDIEIHNSAYKALSNFRDHNIGIIIISNQQAVGKKIISIEKAIEIHNKIINQFENPPIIASFICPHLVSDKCDCRKPGIRMIRTASEIYNVQLQGNYLVGDSYTDLLAAENAGLQPILIKKSHEKMKTINKAIIFENLYETSKYISSKIT
ncbi:HAD-IIIA family hydrolase [Paenibacillus amylolyticus]|uniref:D,D-heptose 1,7-bisphosphate phosphatase n=1 Tax=Paenibacillus amylolyticus TaxID=1451 RepID=A0A5M9WQA8_PAEAM|nr:HAD-IIIA family hydrolase [Paenibacillus amylolyticus]